MRRTLLRLYSLRFTRDDLAALLWIVQLVRKRRAGKTAENT